MFQHNWAIVETATFHNGEVKRRTVEVGLTRRSARRRTGEWQAASGRSKVLVGVIIPADRRPPLPTVVYRMYRDEATR